MAGSGETEIARQLAEELGVADRIVFPGWIAGEAKDRCFKEASIFCLPSYAEGFPMAVLDAWSYNLPVVTTPVGGLPDVLDDGKNALVFNPGDYKKLAEELEQLIDSPTLRQQIAQESHQLADTKFNIDTISDEIERLYLEVLKNKFSYIMKRYLITGGCGMIGSNLTKRLVKEGNEIYIIDNLWRGKLEYLNDENGKPVIDLDTHFSTETLPSRAYATTSLPRSTTSSIWPTL